MTVENLLRLKDIGFTLAGRWLLGKNGMIFDLEAKLAYEKNVLYAFAVNNALTYVGKTTMALRKRMQHYKTPSKDGVNGGSTNKKNNKNIREALATGASVEIFVLLDLGQLTHGGFAINLAAGLEDSLINALSPLWNGGRSAETKKTVLHEPIVLPTISLQKPMEPNGKARLAKANFQLALRQMLAEAMNADKGFVDVNAGSLHRLVGGYPEASHMMPTCCRAMHAEMAEGDHVLAGPPKGLGASLSIRYRLPRL